MCVFMRGCVYVCVLCVRVRVSKVIFLHLVTRLIFVMKLALCGGAKRDQYTDIKAHFEETVMLECSGAENHLTLDDFMWAASVFESHGLSMDVHALSQERHQPSDNEAIHHDSVFGVLCYL
jgi:hypothetical protein